MNQYSNNTWEPYIASVRGSFKSAYEHIYLPPLEVDTVLEIINLSVYSPQLAAARSSFFFMEKDGQRIGDKAISLTSKQGVSRINYGIVTPEWKYGIEIASGAVGEVFHVSVTGKLYRPITLKNKSIK